MSGTQAGFKQDLPPKGGYGPINWARVPGKKRMSGYAAFGIFGVVTVLAWIGYFIEEKSKKRWILEMNDARLALSPLLLAEEQRSYLRQLRSNRDEENKLMKNVPGWETGKLFGEPVFHNLNNRFPVVHPEAYYAHNSWDEMFDRYYKRQTY
jgi:NADH dehydrogenase (ubiquinone) 1 alpha subcomplex subunit 13